MNCDFQCFRFYNIVFAVQLPLLLRDRHFFCVEEVEDEEKTKLPEGSHTTHRDRGYEKYPHRNCAIEEIASKKTENGVKPGFMTMV